MNAKNKRQVREELGDRLAWARKQAGLTQRQVARKVDLHRPSISEIEAGRRKVSSDELAEFAEIYGVSVGWLLGEQEKTLDSGDIEMAARELEKLKADDLDRVINLLKTIRDRGGDS